MEVVAHFQPPAPTDADVWISNSSVTLQAFVDKASALLASADQTQPWMIVQDGNEINS